MSVLYLLRYFLFPFHSSSCKMVDGTQSLRKDQVRTGTSDNYANDEESEYIDDLHTFASIESLSNNVGDI